MIKSGYLYVPKRALEISEISDGFLDFIYESKRIIKLDSKDYFRIDPITSIKDRKGKSVKNLSIYSLKVKGNWKSVLTTIKAKIFDYPKFLDMCLALRTNKIAFFYNIGNGDSDNGVIAVAGDNIKDFYLTTMPAIAFKVTDIS